MPPQKTPPRRSYRVHEFAQLSGVTVRALHHYDREGLLKPAHRSAAGYRLYTESDLLRLEQIVVLKFLGFPLREIRDLVKTGPSALPSTLRRQAEVLAEKRKHLDGAILAIQRALRNIGKAGVSEWQQLAKIIKEITVQNDKTWMGKYFNEEAKAKIRERQGLWSPELHERVSRQWAELFSEVEAALGTDPASPAARKLAERWDALVNEFTGGDPEIAEGLKAMYRDRENWPEQSKQMPLIRPELHAFIQKAREAAQS
jgi:DNA-binding transcriptional MerR regulator